VSFFLKSPRGRIFFFLLASAPLYSLEFSILNKGDTIFQEIYIDYGEARNNYYYNFGVLGLEPGARHTINIYSEDEILFCTFYLYGISQESYIIENVAIEQNSIVYILPEHYREFPDEYRDLTDPDAVYGATPIDRSRGFPSMPEVINEDSIESRNIVDLEIFNYTNSPIFRVYLDAGKTKGLENFLNTDVLLPSESITLHIPLDPGNEYSLRLKSSGESSFIKKISLPLESDFLVFYDSDDVNGTAPRTVSLRNNTAEEITEIFLIDQVSSRKEELLKGDILAPDETREVLVLENFGLCDIVARTAGKGKIYIFDKDIKKDSTIPISDD